MENSRKVELASMYLRQPVFGGHSITLDLERCGPGRMTGKASIDPNICSVNLWGDREICTRIAIQVRTVEATRMRTYDPEGHKRAHWALEIEGISDVKIALIEYPGANLWYLSVQPGEEDAAVVPLVDAKLFASRDTKAAHEHATGA